MEELQYSRSPRSHSDKTAQVHGEGRRPDSRKTGAQCRFVYNPRKFGIQIRCPQWTSINAA